MVTNETSVLARYECGHTFIFKRSYAPKVGEHVFCQKCNTPQTVESSADEWRVRCRTCRYSRAFHSLRFDATRALTRHSIRHPTHVIHLLNGARVVMVAEPSASQESLPF